MKSEDFKNTVKEIKEFLKGKEISLKVVSNNGIDSLKFQSLKSFGYKILELEKLGFGFSFIKVGNPQVERSIMKQSDLEKWMVRGVWTSIHVNASNLIYKS